MCAHLLAQPCLSWLQVWALDVGGEHDSAVVTGAADGGIVLWADCTEGDKAKAQAETDARLQHEQVRTLLDSGVPMLLSQAIANAILSSKSQYFLRQLSKLLAAACDHVTMSCAKLVKIWHVSCRTLTTQSWTKTI
jgi:hypothetical protein